MPEAILAVSAQQRLGIVFALVLFLGWVAYGIAHYVRRRRDEPPGSEMELAPNRKPYYDDDTLETKRLDRALLGALSLLGILAIGLPLYWLNEPDRQAGAEIAFDDAAVHRGEELFAPTAEGGFNCAGCHGIDGSGGVASATVTDPDGTLRQVAWDAPAINTALLRFNEEEVRNILIYGRPNTPMPAWGTDGGGPMTSQQINDLIAYMDHIQLTPEEAMAEAAGVTDGQELFEGYCARCHTQGWAYGEPGVAGGGAFGPSLVGGATIRQFPEPEDHAAFIAEGSDREEAYGERGVGSGRMPGFGSQLSTEQIQAIVEYERGL